MEQWYCLDFISAKTGSTDSAQHSTVRSTRNLVLLIFSLAFYAWGEPKYILLLLFSILLNYGMGLWVGKYPQKTMGKWLVGATVLANIDKEKPDIVISMYFSGI